MYFVYRSHYMGPLSKVVRRLPDKTVLAWFQRGWQCADPNSWVEDELGVDVHELHHLFVDAQHRKRPVPMTTERLRLMLHRHLPVVDRRNQIHLDEHSLRVLTEDDDVELAFFFFDDEVVASAPERLAYLLHEDWPLPAQVDQPGPFVPDVPPYELDPAGVGDVATYLVFLTFYDHESLPRRRSEAFPGIELPALAQHLRSNNDTFRWVPELRVLRALIAPDEDDLGPALDRCNRWAGYNPKYIGGRPDLRVDHDAAYHAAMELVETTEVDPEERRKNAWFNKRSYRRPEASMLQVDDHLAQLAIHRSEHFGYQQWFLFDSTWAASHPNLANSLLRYASNWDPLDDHSLIAELGFRPTR